LLKINTTFSSESLQNKLSSQLTLRDANINHFVFLGLLLTISNTSLYALFYLPKIARDMYLLADPPPICAVVCAGKIEHVKNIRRVE